MPSPKPRPAAPRTQPWDTQAVGGAAPAPKDALQLQVHEKPLRAKGTTALLQGDGSPVSSPRAGSVRWIPRVRRERLGQSRHVSRVPVRGWGAAARTAGERPRDRAGGSWGRALRCADPRAVRGGCSDHDVARPRPPLAPRCGEAGSSAACSRGVPAASRTVGTWARPAALEERAAAAGRARRDPARDGCEGAWRRPRPSLSIPPPGQQNQWTPGPMRQRPRRLDSGS